MGEMVKNCQKWSKWSKMVQNGPKWSKMVQMVENGQKWSKMAGLTLSGPGIPTVKDEVNRPEGPPARSWAPEGPLNF